MAYLKYTNSFLVWDASLLVTVGSRQCLDMIVGKIENGLERGFVKHYKLNSILRRHFGLKMTANWEKIYRDTNILLERVNGSSTNRALIER